MTHTIYESMQWLRWARKFSKSKHMGLKAGFCLPKESGLVIYIHRYESGISRPSFRFLQKWDEQFKDWFPKLKYER